MIRPTHLTDVAQRIVREVLIDQVRREYRAELASEHPGSRRRLTKLRAVAERLADQIESGEVRS